MITGSVQKWPDLAAFRTELAIMTGRGVGRGRAACGAGGRKAGGGAGRPRVVSGSSAAGPTLSPVDDQLLRHILDGDDPAVLVAVALAAADRPLERAAALAADARTRRAVAVALAYLGGDHDRALLLARDHLADHPADLLVAHVAALAERT